MLCFISATGVIHASGIVEERRRHRAVSSIGSRSFFFFFSLLLFQQERRRRRRWIAHCCRAGSHGRRRRRPRGCICSVEGWVRPRDPGESGVESMTLEVWPRMKTIYSAAQSDGQQRKKTKKDTPPSSHPHPLFFFSPVALFNSTSERHRRLHPLRRRPGLLPRLSL